MKTVGLVVEYNPLHNGHHYHFQQSKIESGADAVIAIMSGNFLQRGEPAMVNKWARAEMALRMGVDLVLELPVAYSTQPAEWFAFGAVSALDSTGVVDSLCFGSESGDIRWLHRVANAQFEESIQFHELLQSELKAGIPYPAAYGKAVARYVPGTDEIDLAKPNNTLGLHYLIALKRLHSRIVPLTITRQKAEYNQTDITDQQIASATALRHMLFEQQSLEDIAPFVPTSTLEVLRREWSKGHAPIGWEHYAKPLLLQLMNHSAGELAQYHEVTEGLEHRIKQSLSSLTTNTQHTVEDLIGLLKTKRYTRTKLQRMLLRILLNHSKPKLSADVLGHGVPYLRVLGFSDKGRELLRIMKKTARVPIVTKVTSLSEPSPMLDLDIQATSVYSLAYPSASERDLFRDYYEPPVQI
ncbi:nucleotidyltransferase [Paenibacillus sp. RC67]|uniref:nucleotidyltransferase n=1 Tax=Paenibacillus sp. RC67 TaxID=3039392 RepID=UPI0024AD8080|nr:nucleotidyltransferase [Paenibacillus sp. RC67]